MIRYATAEDVKRWPWKEGPLSKTIRGVVIEENGELKAIGGAFNQCSKFYVFSEIAEGYCNKRAIIIAAHWLMDMLKGLPLVALADEGLPTAPTFLRHLGFRKEDDIWHGPR